MSIATPKFTATRKVSPGIAMSPGNGEGTFRQKKYSTIIPPDFSSLEFHPSLSSPASPPASPSPSISLSSKSSSFGSADSSGLSGPLSRQTSVGGGSAKKSDWPNTKAAYELKDVIGIGATAVVHEALCLPRNETCAIKRINLDKLNTSMDELLKEIHAMCACNHENVVTYYTSFVVQEELWLILRLLEGGSLLDIIKRRKKLMDCSRGVFDEASIATILKETLKGLEYFHSHGQIHRDIKAGNILMGNDGTVQIADFGVASWLSANGDRSRQRVCHTFVGTPCWMAPEVMEQNTGYDYKADIWSLGITAIEMVTGRAPYHKYPPMKILMLTLQNDAPTIETDLDEKDKERYKHYGRSLRKMIADCLQKDPAKRPTATELLKHSFFKSNAKDKKYLYSTLIRPLSESNIKVQQRARKVSAVRRRRVSHLNPAGEWVWSSEDDTDDEGDDSNNGGANSSIPSSPVPTSTQGDSNSFIANTHANNNANTVQAAAGAGAGAGAGTGIGVAPQESLSTVMEAKPINIVLRVRNAKRELNDIRFEYIPGADTEEGIASELVAASLIAQKDMPSIVANLTQLIQTRESSKTINFILGSSVQPEKNGFPPKPSEIDTTMVGFANMTITE